MKSTFFQRQNWEAEIRKAIRRCDVVIVCLTEASISRVGYVQKEIRSMLNVADEQPEDAIFVIPARLEACEVPDRLRRWQWVDLFQENGYELLIRALSARSKALYAESLQRSIVSIKQDPKPVDETMQGAVGVAEQQVRSGYSIPTGLRFDGLYVQENTSPIPHTSYIRLHPNGLVFVLSSTAAAEEVFKWLATESEHISKGHYTSTANRINFSAVSSSGQVDYSGTIEGVDVSFISILTAESMVMKPMAYGGIRP